MGSSDDVKSGGSRAEGDGARRKSERPSMRPGGPASLLGMTLSGRYKIERIIGEGGMGAVYQAEHTHMRKRLAIKVLHPEMSRLSEVVARFEREAMAAAHIDHPNVATATDFGKLDDGSFFLVLEYVEGHSLRDEIGKSRLELGRALHIVRQIASGLQRAHQMGIVHRDLKPENVMLIEKDDDKDFVKVLDFGIAKVPVGELGSSGVKGAGQPVLTQLGMVYGTPEYMAPEQALGQDVDARADIYALGVIAYEMMTGLRPFDSDSKVQLLGMHVTAPVPPMSAKAPDANVPPDVEAIVIRCLAKESTHRWSDAKELIDAITIVAAKLSSGGRISALPPPLSMSRGRPSHVSHAGGGHGIDSSPSAPSVNFGAAGSALSSFHRAALEITGANRVAPHGANVKLMLAGAGALVLIVASIVVMVMLASSLKSGGTPSASATSSVDRPVSSSIAPEPPPAPPPLSVETEIVTARAAVDKGNYGSAIESLAPLETQYPKNAAIHQLLERAYTGQKNAKDAMREAESWLDVDVKAAEDIKLQEDVRNAAIGIGTGGVEPAFELLEQKMRDHGVDILYDIAWGASGQQYPAAAKHAKDALAKADVRALASKGLSVALDFRDAKTCESKHALLERAQDDGDARVIVQLKQYVFTAGCGFLRRHDCYPCMHKDQALKEAIAAIEARLKK
jgi:serine/threonine protein kinase